MAGQFISVEGIEGVGKSSNMAVLVETLRAAGIDVLTTREPGGTPLAESIRDMLVRPGEEKISDISELLLIFAARSQNVRNVIRPALDDGQWVVSDRFTDSSRAYQGGGRGLSMQTIDKLANWVHPETWPDLTLLLDAPVETGMRRAGARGAPDRFEQEQHDFFARVRDCYLDLAANEPHRFVVVDATRDLDTVNAEVAQIASRFLNSKIQ